MTDDQEPASMLIIAPFWRSDAAAFASSGKRANTTASKSLLAIEAILVQSRTAAESITNAVGENPIDGIAPETFREVAIHPYDSAVAVAGSGLPSAPGYQATAGGGERRGPRPHPRRDRACHASN